MLYPMHDNAPQWARTAYRFGWITLKQRVDAEPWPEDEGKGGGIYDLFYAESPLWVLMRKSDDVPGP